MFSTSIRSRPDLASLLPCLSSSTSGLRETSLHAHDLSIPLPTTKKPPPTPQTALKCILLTPLSLTTPHRPSTLSRIERLTTLTASRALTAVVFVMTVSSPSSVLSATAGGSGDGDGDRVDMGAEDDVMHGAGAAEAYMQLQVLVEEIGLREAPPLLPVLSAKRVGEFVRGYAGGLAVCGMGSGEGDGNGDGKGKGEGRGNREGEVDVNVRRDLLGLGTCTAPTKPLSEHTTFVLGDLAHSLRDVTTMATTASGKRKLAEFLEEREIRDISDFWGEEWIAD